ncbi:DUF1361 domain-containing protein [Calothrix sp. PCC 7507]|uniref:DUF1361 domain-containing protein n=1 Tax=Calothrix sp. PCC 7507 TaxID=99598 RepID=UPI00029EE7E2|nr:DUF1361 domain-containing protein [Calothrix sp. PCC 7507]AFY33461.1 protein of unknown function DUF1361 [Calothrix sp. PCC 7507]
MKEELIELIATVIQVLRINIDWMTWNLFLAFIPLVLSVLLFRNGRGRSLLWWLTFLVFYAFLPNAPYLLTDVIHLIDDIRTIQSVWIITLVLIPIYLLVILAGFQAYVISLINLGYYLHRIGKSQWILRVELITHALSAIGIYWGRFLRFNSWDFVTQPDAVLTRGVEEILGKQPLVIIAVTFVVLIGLHSIMKRVSLGFFKRSHNEITIQSQAANHKTPKAG